jgi:hypothetical protein
VVCAIEARESVAEARRAHPPASPIAGRAFRPKLRVAF